MEDQFPYFAVFAGAGVILLTLVLIKIDRKKLPAGESVRRGTGNALLGLQQFVEPSVEYVFQSQNVEQREADDDQGQGGDEDAVSSGLAEALCRTPVDPEEVGATSPLRNAWASIGGPSSNTAVADELQERPFRAPSMPPVRRVAPGVNAGVSEALVEQATHQLGSGNARPRVGRDRRTAAMLVRRSSPISSSPASTAFLDPRDSRPRESHGPAACCVGSSSILCNRWRRQYYSHAPPGVSSHP